MRYLLILIICSSYLLVNCAVSKCYDFSEIEYDYSNLTIKECKPPYTDFCATITVRNGEIPYFTCGDKEFCISKGCYSTYCPTSGTYDLDYSGLSDVKFTVTCCDTDLCNVESSAENAFKNCFSTLYYMCFLFCSYIASL